MRDADGCSRSLGQHRADAGFDSTPRGYRLPAFSPYGPMKPLTSTYPNALGADNRLLAELMGHRDARSVEKYAKLDSSVVRLEIERAYRRAAGQE